MSRFRRCTTSTSTAAHFDFHLYFLHFHYFCIYSISGAPPTPALPAPRLLPFTPIGTKQPRGADPSLKARAGKKTASDPATQSQLEEKTDNEGAEMTVGTCLHRWGTSTAVSWRL